MAKQEDRYENENIDVDLSGMGSVLHGGSAVQQGMRGYSRRTEERGRNEFYGNGGSAELDPGRIHEGGRHYGRPAVDEPAPDGGPPGRPDLGEMGALQPAQLQVIEADAMGPVALASPSMLQTRHGEASFTNDRAEVEPKPPAAEPTRKTTARATPQTARTAATPTGKKAAGRGTARSEVTTKATRKATAKTGEVKKVIAKASSVKKAPAKASSVKKAAPKVIAAKKVTAKKVTAKKVTAKKVTAKKATAKRATAKKATAKRATAKKAVR